jgi:hypothetical protein
MLDKSKTCSLDRISGIWRDGTFDCSWADDIWKDIVRKDDNRYDDCNRKDYPKRWQLQVKSQLLIIHYLQ